MKLLLKLELGLVNKFSQWCQSPHWFFFWVIYFIAWTVFRQVLHPSWYSTDMDFLFVAWTSAILPFFVENAMKNSQAEQLNRQSEQISMLDAQSKLLVELTQLNIEMSKKTLASLEELSDDVEEIAEDIESAEESEEVVEDE